MSEVSSPWEVVIGLEVHAQLLTRSKAFCACSTRYGAPPNTQVCPVCMALPGALPVYNREAAALACRAALALGSTVRRESVFARKNYFYPDLPKGYQISQYEEPLAEGGAVPIEVSGVHREIRLTRIHVEEDAGKNFHEDDGSSRVDLNRAGVPLIEIVSEPDLRSAEEAMAYVKSLRQILRWLSVCDGNMEEGSLRCDANVSVRPRGREAFGTKVEVKNMNSVRFVGRAIQFEVARHIEVLEAGGQIHQETRTFDAARGETVFMRSKEQAHDYRYFPDPDLPPLRLSESFLEEVRESVRELPHLRAQRFQEEWGLSAYDAQVLTQERGISDFFQEAVEKAGGASRAKKVANWMMGEVLRKLNEEGGEAGKLPLRPAHLATLVELAEKGEISGPAVRQVFEEVWKTGEDPVDVLDRLGLRSLSDTGMLDEAIRSAFVKNPKEYQRLAGGEDKLVGFFMGQVMKETSGKGEPRKVQERIRVLLREG